MVNDDLQPRSRALRDALSKADSDQPTQVMLTVVEAAAHLRISKWSLYRLIQRGELTSVKIGSRRLIPMRAISQLIERLEAETEG